jgi:photosystem II stability/assembly factor-like uncharacterized protein
MTNIKSQITKENRSFGICRLPFAICYLSFAICHLLFVICSLTACQAVEGVNLNPFSTPEAESTVTSQPAETVAPPPEMGVPPGPVLNIAPLPDGEFLAGVGPIGDAETGFEWRVYAGRDEDWRRLTWPPEAIPRSLHPLPSENTLFAVPFSNALFGRGQAWGLMRSRDGGRTWQQALEGLGDPYVMHLAFSPPTEADEDGTLYAVTWYSGVYRSTDDGETWEAMPLETEVEPSGGANPYDLTVAVSPDFVASAGEGLLMASFSQGLQRWDVAAENWHTIPLTVTATVEDFEPPEAQLTAGAIAFSPNFAQDGAIYLLSGYAGLFRSTDRGETWEHVDLRLPLPPPFVADFSLAAASADEAYVLLDTDETDSILGRPARALYRTQDGGRSWDVLEDPPTLGWVSAFALDRDADGGVLLHLGGSRGGVSSHRADELSWDRESTAKFDIFVTSGYNTHS